MWDVCSTTVTWTECTGHMVTVVCYVCGTYRSNIRDSSERTGHVVSVVCYVCVTYVLM